VSKKRQAIKQLAQNLPKVEVVWLDSYISTDHEADLDAGTAGFGGVIECRDIGYLVSKRRYNPAAKRYELVLSVSRCFSDNTTRISNTIPCGWVKQIIYLEERQDGRGSETGGSDVQLHHADTGQAPA
jgi:hypothetical protein